MPQARGTVRGPNKTHHVVFYGLSTCIWCKRTRKLLEEQGVTFDYVYIDLLGGQEREEALTRVSRWNPAQSSTTFQGTQTASAMTTTTRGHQALSTAISCSRR